MGEPRRFFVTIRTPNGGEIAEGKSCAFSDGTVEVRDDKGNPVGVALIRPGIDNPEAAARKLLREKRGQHTRFNDPINYRRGRARPLKIFHE